MSYVAAIGAGASLLKGSGSGGSGGLLGGSGGSPSSLKSGNIGTVTFYHPLSPQTPDSGLVPVAKSAAVSFDTASSSNNALIYVAGGGTILLAAVILYSNLKK